VCKLASQLTSSHMLLSRDTGMLLAMLLFMLLSRDVGGGDAFKLERRESPAQSDAASELYLRKGVGFKTEMRC